MKSKNENQAEETYSSHKEICVVRILVTRKQSQFILNWGPYPVSYATDEYCTNIFYFKVWVGPWHSAPPTPCASEWVLDCKIFVFCL